MPVLAGNRMLQAPVLVGNRMLQEPVLVGNRMLQEMHVTSDAYAMAVMAFIKKKIDFFT